MSDGAMDIGLGAGPIERAFRRRLNEVTGRVLELGTMRWEQDRPTHHGIWLHRDAEHVKVDALNGLDVDVVADAHYLDQAFESGYFDAVIAVSVWEHLRRPWVAVDQLAAVTAPGAPVLIVTHQTFPVHGYPDDYFRFSDMALASLFDGPMWTDVEARHSFPCKIVPPPEVTRWNEVAPAYLNVEAVAVRSEEPWTR